MQVQPIAAASGGVLRTGQSAGGGRLTIRAIAVLAALIGLVLVYATDQIVPAGTDRQAQLRLWLAARSAGIVAYLLLTFQVTLGLVLSHPTNKSTWKLSKALFPWHDQLWIFISAFVGAHVLAIVLDPYAGVGPGGAFIPGLSEYRNVPVAVGTLALYAFLATTLTARYTRLLPRGMWLVLHRLAIVVLGLAWAHGVLAGSDSGALEPLYISTGLVVLLAAVYRYWIVRERRQAPGTHSEVAPR
jgi:DMSO/TMAO reductase YedYZ heme-binding membrane subunit